MLELLYPSEGDAPVVPAPTAHDADLLDLFSRNGTAAGEEMFPVVDAGGMVIGVSRRSYCHSGAKPLHPVVHLHIIDREGRIYLQKRSARKKIQPSKWDTAVGGHVLYGESFMEALFRESSEELGFVEYNPIHMLTYVFESPVEKELVCVFAAVGSSFVLTPDGDELSDGRFWTIGEIESHILTDASGKKSTDGTLTPNFVSEFELVRDQLLALL